jgi:hypothetical protein
MILITVFASTFALLLKLALATLGVVAAVVLFLFLLATLVAAAIESLFSSSSGEVVRA